jgi:NitT/TauT family transport system permease protein
MDAGAPRQRLHVPANVGGVVVPLIGLAIGAGIWELIGRHTQAASFAPFSETVKALWSMTTSGELPRALESSLQLFGAGLGFAILIGFFLGLLLARIRLLRIGLEPYILMLYATPMVALIPFILSLFGFEFRAKVIVVTLFGLWPILINTLEGARSVSADLLEVARSYRSSEPKLWRHVIIPYTLPYTMTGVRQGIARSLTYTQRFDTAHVLAAVLAITLLATVLMAIGRAIENYFARWKAGV